MGWVLRQVHEQSILGLLAPAQTRHPHALDGQGCWLRSHGYDHTLSESGCQMYFKGLMGLNVLLCLVHYFRHLVH